MGILGFIDSGYCGVDKLESNNYKSATIPYSPKIQSPSSENIEVSG